jgi:hypothetical protein
MLGLTAGEWFVVVFVTLAVVSAPWWPRAAEALYRRWNPGEPPRRGSPK